MAETSRSWCAEVSSTLFLALGPPWARDFGGSTGVLQRWCTTGPHAHADLALGVVTVSRIPEESMCFNGQYGAATYLFTPDYVL